MAKRTVAARLASVLRQAEREQKALAGKSHRLSNQLGVVMEQEQATGRIVAALAPIVGGAK